MSHSTPVVDWTLEVVPRHAAQAVCLQGLVREVFVTMIPGTDPLEVCECLKKLRKLNFSPIPHVAARGFTRQEQIEKFFASLQEQGIKKALLLAGGAGKPEGPYPDSFSLMQTDAFQNSGVRTVALAGHPEGNPVDPDSRANLRRKCDWLRERGYGVEVVTQWSFSPAAVNDYLRELKEAGVDAPVRVGVPGPASLKTLLKYAQVCGVTAAKEVLRKQGLSFGMLLVRNNPAKFVSQVKGTTHFHLYPFGGLEKCADWLRENAASI